MVSPHLMGTAAVASAIVSVRLLTGGSASSSAPASSRPSATASSGDVSIEGNGPAGELAALVPLLESGLIWDQDCSAGISTPQFQQLGLESWGGVVGCNDTDDPAVSEYVALEFTDAQTKRHGAASVFLYTLEDPQAGAAW